MFLETYLGESVVPVKSLCGSFGYFILFLSENSQWSQVCLYSLICSSPSPKYLNETGDTVCKQGKAFWFKI